MIREQMRPQTAPESGGFDIGAVVRQVATVAAHVVQARQNNAPSNPFYGSNRIPPSSGSYTRIAKGAGMRLTLDEDITANTLPTYAAMRRLYREAGLDDGVESTTYLEELARREFVRYHVLRFACASPE